MNSVSGLKFLMRRMERARSGVASYTPVRGLHQVQDNVMPQIKDTLTAEALNNKR